MEKKNNYGIVLVVMMIVSFICGTLGAYVIITNMPDSVTQSVVKNISEVDYNEQSIAGAVENVKDAVVAVVTYQNGNQVSTGTGFVYKMDDNYGYLLTNNHVIESCDKVEVIFSNDTTVEVEVVGSETYSDIAVLKVKKEYVLDVVEIASNETSKVGDTVFTIGSPMGLDYSGTVTKGILSGKDRLVEVSFSGSSSDYYMKVLQTDAAINPGNSGGPLLDIDGKVLGINSLKLVENEIEGMGFAIPIEDAIHYADIILEKGTVERPYFGIGMLDITDSYNLWQSGITIPKDITSGVVVVSIDPNNPADKAGIKVGDIIISLGGEEVKTVAELRYELYKHEPNEKVEIKYIRNGKENTTTVTLIKKEQ